MWLAGKHNSFHIGNLLLNSYLPVHGAMTPAHVSPTTAAKMRAAATDPPTKNTYLNSDLDKKFCRYLMKATA